MRFELFLVLVLMFGFFVVAENQTDYTSLLNEEKIELEMGEKVETKLSDDKKILDVDGFKINLEKIREYQGGKEGELGGYEFNSKKYDKSDKKITKIRVDKENVIFEYEDGGSISLAKSSKFDPMTRKFELKGGSEYEWMGEGTVKVSEDGVVELGFVRNKENSGDMTNFAIIKSKSGKVLSPFQSSMKSNIKPPSTVKKPANGFETFESGGKLYSLDSSGRVRLIETAKIKLEGDKIVEAEGSMVEGEDSRIFVSDKFSFLKVDGNYILEEKGVLTIVSKSTGNSFYYEMKKDLVKIDVKGDGIIKNGDKLLLFEKGGVLIKTIGKEWAKSNGEFLYGVGELVTYRLDGKQYKVLKIEKDKDGKLKLFRFDDATIKPVDKIPGVNNDTIGVKGDGKTPADPSEKAVFEQINRARGKELAWDDKLANLAREHSRRMASRGSIGHDGFSERLRAAGCRMGTENVAMFTGSKSPEGVGKQFTSQWMNSPGHYKNIMKMNQRTTGIGVVKTSRGTYATQIFC